MLAALLFEIVVSGCGVSSPRKTMSELALKSPIGGSGIGLSERHKVLTMCKRDGLAYPHVFGVRTHRSNQTSTVARDVVTGQTCESPGERPGGRKPTPGGGFLSSLRAGREVGLESTAVVVDPGHARPLLRQVDQIWVLAVTATRMSRGILNKCCGRRLQEPRATNLGLAGKAQGAASCVLVESGCKTAALRMSRR